MTQQTVLLVGATGETGFNLLNGLVEAGTFRIVCLIRPASANKPAAKNLSSLPNVEVRVGSVDDPVDSLVELLKDIDIILSATGPEAQLAQINLATAASKVKTVKRFVPCGFITVCPPGVMLLRDDKEEVLDHIKRLYLPYTYIDCGYWHEISFVKLPSGKADYAALRPVVAIEGNPHAKNMLTGLADIGRYTAKIIVDDRTLNKYVSVWTDALSQNEIVDIQEEISGEDIRSTMKMIPSSTIEEEYKKVTEYYATLSDEERRVKDRAKMMQVWYYQYLYSKYVREDNTPEHADYLGFLDVKKLYPDFKPVTFREFVKDLVDGKAYKPYAQMQMEGYKIPTRE